MFCQEKLIRALSAGLFVLSIPMGPFAQEVIRLPQVKPVSANEAAAMQQFAFASDGPAGPGWTRPGEIARVYPHDDLPALFRRTIQLDSDVPQRARLSWIFTGNSCRLCSPI
jgi:hypothetical protein